MKTKCLLMGGAGFIGKNLTAYLKKQGYDLTLYDFKIKERFSSEELAGIKVIEKNFFEDDELEKSMVNQDVIIHLISSVNPAISMKNIYNSYQNDLIKSLELIEKANQLGIKRIIFISSGGTVYGNYLSDDYREDMPTNPINHYGIMKLSIEKILLMYNQVYGMDNIILRVANPYGVGQDPTKNLGAIAVFTNKIMNGEDIQLYGDGEVVRDYIYIEDLVRMVEKSIKYEKKQDISPIFNVGSGKGTSLNQIIEIIATKLNKKVSIEYIESRKIDVSRNVLNMEKTIHELEIQPQYSIEYGIGEYIKSIKA